MSAVVTQTRDMQSLLKTNRLHGALVFTQQKHLGIKQNILDDDDDNVDWHDLNTWVYTV